VITSRLGVPGRRSCSPSITRATRRGLPDRATERAAILTADGVGEWATLTVGTGERGPGGTKIAIDREIHFPHSLGMLYSTFTA
jgi:carbamoyltransferase